MADHPLRPATHRRLGRPLPHQLANGTQAHQRAVACKQRPPFSAGPEGPVVLSGISSSFPELSRARRQITHALLTRAPLYLPPEGGFLVRLACVRHAASVNSEPGSNSPVEWSSSRTRAHYLVFKEQIPLHNIIDNFVPLSRGHFLFPQPAPRSGTNLFNRSPLPCQAP